jgi:hypothetical protein
MSRPAKRPARQVLTFGLSHRKRSFRYFSPVAMADTTRREQASRARGGFGIEIVGLLIPSNDCRDDLAGLTVFAGTLT